jgi:hypothetical protein
MKKALKPSFQMADDPALTLGNVVITALTGNAHIPSPQPTLVQLQAAWDDYNNSLAKARYGSRNDRSQKNADKEALITLLRAECDYVNMIANGDEVTLSSTGFALSKEREPQILGIPEAKVEAGENSGELILSTPAVNGAVSYKHQYTADPNLAVWSEKTTSRATCPIGSLQPGTLYSLRIVAIGTNDQVTVSNVITKMAA